MVLNGLKGDALRIEPVGRRDPRSQDDQIILYRVVFGKGPEEA